MPPGAGGALGAMGVDSFFASACSRAFSLSIQPFPTKQGGNPVRLKNKIAVITGGGQAHDRAEVRLHRQHRAGKRQVPLQLGRRLLRGEGGLIMLTKLQAMEWAPYGISANAITPGYIRTPGTEAMYAAPEIYEGRRKGVPMGRVGSGEDIAGPAVFLACDESRYTTGSVLGADGGQAVGYFLTVPGRRFSGGRID